MRSSNGTPAESRQLFCCTLACVLNCHRAFRGDSLSASRSVWWGIGGLLPPVNTSSQSFLRFFLRIPQTHENTAICQRLGYHDFLQPARNFIMVHQLSGFGFAGREHGEGRLAGGTAPKATLPGLQSMMSNVMPPHQSRSPPNAIPPPRLPA